MAATAVSMFGHVGPPSFFLPLHHFWFILTMQAIQQKVDKVASSGVADFDSRDSGTGKGVLARYIHNRSRGA